MEKNQEQKKKLDLSLDEDVNDKVDKLIDTKQLDESNPLERAKKFEEVKRFPPEPGYMKVELYEGEQNGEPVVVSKSKGPDGTGDELVYVHDPFMTIDLKTAIDADVAAVPSNTVPMLIDQSVQLAMNEKKTFKPEKRKEEFNWWWLVFGLLCLPGVLLLLYLFFGG